MRKFKHELDIQFFGEEIKPEENVDETPQTAEEWFDSLVEENKENVEFLTFATEIKKKLVTKPEVNNDELEKEKAKLQKDRQRLYDTFMSLGVTDVEHIEVDEVEETTTLPLNDLINSL